MFKKPRIKLGILGAGSFVQRRILPIIKDIDSIQVTCLHKQNLKEAQNLAAQFNIPYAVASRQELLSHPEVDAVFIATPNHCHEEDAIACAHALKPTLCEKPLAPSCQAIIRMIEAFSQNSVPLFVGHSLRFKPAIQKAKELLETGSLGKLLHIRAYFALTVPSDNWRHKKSCGGGVLQDIGVHLIDLIHFISGECIESIQAIAEASTVSAIGQLSSGAYISFECSLNEPYRSGFEVIGSKTRLISINSLRQTYDFGESLCHVLEDDSRVYLPLKSANIYAEELKHFSAVLSEGIAPLIPAEISLQNQGVIEAIFQ